MHGQGGVRSHVVCSQLWGGDSLSTTPGRRASGLQDSIVRFRPLGVKVRYMMFIRILKTDEPAKVEGYLETGEVVTTDDGC
jgi:hypothetical protein